MGKGVCSTLPSKSSVPLSRLSPFIKNWSTNLSKIVKGSEMHKFSNRSDLYHYGLREKKDIRATVPQLTFIYKRVYFNTFQCVIIHCTVMAEWKKTMTRTGASYAVIKPEVWLLGSQNMQS